MNNQAEQSDGRPDPSPARWNAATLIAAAVVVIIVVAATAALTTHRHHDDYATTSTDPAPTPTQTPVPAPSGFAPPRSDPFGRRIDLPANPAGQPLPQTVPHHVATDSDWLTAAPAGTLGKGGWQQVNGVVVPYSTSDGPTQTIDGVAAGWTHTPQGAALALAWIAWQLNARPGDRALYQRGLADPDMAAFDRINAAHTVPDQLPETETRWLLASSAFHVDSYDDDLAVVRIATTTAPDDAGTPQWMTAQLAAVWKGGDWRLLSPTGSTPSEATIASLHGWTLW